VTRTTRRRGALVSLGDANVKKTSRRRPNSSCRRQGADRRVSELASSLTGNEVPLDRGCGFESRALRLGL
jgi:hypothetical protein